MLKWYVLNYKFNEREVKHYNVLNGWEDKIKNIRKKIATKAELKEWLRKEFMYYYWSRTEHEIQVAGLFAKEEQEFKKIDVWYQLEPNLDIITDYIITELKFKGLK